MEFGEDQKENFIKFINSKWSKPQVCPICHAQKWIIPDYIFEVRDAKSGFTKNAKISPIIELLCGNCGYTLFFNAIIAGAYKKEKTKAPNETGSSSTKNDTSKK